MSKPTPEALPSARIAAAGAGLNPTERKVVEAILQDRASIIDMTAERLAQKVSVSRASVIRTAQKLGYQGFPQLRVALAQELAGERVIPETATTVSEVLRNRVSHIASKIEASFGMIDDDTLTAFLARLDAAPRVLVIGHGFSTPLALDLVQRLISAGRPAEIFSDPMTQRIAARQLGEDDLCIIVSGSGENHSSNDVALQATDSGATVVALTSFSESTLSNLADIALVVPPTEMSFSNELLHTSRVGLAIFIEQIIELLHGHRGDNGANVRSAVLGIVADALEE